MHSEHHSKMDFKIFLFTYSPTLAPNLAIVRLSVYIFIRIMLMYDKSENNNGNLDL